MWYLLQLGASQNPMKMEIVSSYQVPTNVKQVKQFLGLGNYNSQFVPDYSKIAEPLHKLLRKGSTYKAGPQPVKKLLQNWSVDLWLHI